MIKQIVIIRTKQSAAAIEPAVDVLKNDYHCIVLYDADVDTFKFEYPLNHCFLIQMQSHTSIEGIKEFFKSEILHEPKF